MMKVAIMLGAAGLAAATCTEDGWCATGNFDVYYKCEANVEECLETKVSLPGAHENYVKLQYKLPAYKNGYGDVIQEFDTDLSKIGNESSYNAQRAYMKLQTPLSRDESLSGYLMVSQSVTFEAISLSNATMEVADADFDKGDKSLDICLLGKTGEKCDDVAIPQANNKYSFAVYQVFDCGSNTDCIFYLRTVLDLTKVAIGESLYFNGNTSLTDANFPVGETDVTISTVQVGDLAFTFPTAVNVNNENVVEDGAKIYLEKAYDATAKQLHLMMKVDAPGAEKFIMFNPTVTGAVVTGAATGAVVTGDATGAVVTGASTGAAPVAVATGAAPVTTAPVAAAAFSSARHFAVPSMAVAAIALAFAL